MEAQRRGSHCGWGGLPKGPGTPGTVLVEERKILLTSFLFGILSPLAPSILASFVHLLRCSWTSPFMMFTNVYRVLT